MVKNQIQKSTKYRNFKDLYFSAFLLLNGVKLRSISSQGNIVFFEFDDDPKLPTLTAQYFSSQGVVEPLGFLSDLKRLLFLIKDELKNNG